MVELLEANRIVKQHFANNYLPAIHLKTYDDDGLYFYSETPIVMTEEQLNKEEVRFRVRLKRWSQLRNRYKDVDFYFTYDGESSSHNVMQEIEEHIFIILREIINDDLLFKSLLSFVKSELRERKIDEILF